MQPSWLHLELSESTFDTAGFMQPGWLHLELNESTLDTDFCVTVLGPPAIVFLADGGPLGHPGQQLVIPGYV